MKDTMMHHRQPRPTVRTRSFQRRCAKETMEIKPYHQSEKICSSMSLPPKVTRIIFFKKKKEKKGGYSTICLRPFVRGKINREKLRVSQKISPPSQQGHGVECGEILSWWYGVSQAII